MTEEKDLNERRAPDFRVVQAGTDKDGKSTFTSVGGIWKQPKSKAGKDFSVLKLGNLRLLVFPNEPKA